jgi:type II restriction enzyme
MFCPVCGREHLAQFEANKPVADFYCESCRQEYELKSKDGESLGNKITDGAYATMIERITSNNNPNLFYMTHKNDWVNNLILIPKFFFTPSIIERRKPLPDTARRAGWVGCHIDISTVPHECMIGIVKQGVVSDIESVVNAYNRIKSLQNNNIESRGWLLDIMYCISQIPDGCFQLSQLYQFEPLLAQKHPDNNYIQAKIRQQLQILRDKGFIEFIGRGVYRRNLMWVCNVWGG